MNQENSNENTSTNNRELAHHNDYNLIQKIEMYEGNLSHPNMLRRYEEVYKDSAKKNIDNGIEETWEVPNKELIEAIKEAEYMDKHPEEYKAYDSAEQMAKDILSDDDEPK